MKNRNFLCFDIGGTTIKYALFDETGNLVKRFEHLDTKVLMSQEKLGHKILEIINTTLISHNIEGVGISTAGVVNRSEGKVIYAGKTIPNYGSMKFKEVIESKYNIRCVVENDVDAALYGEKWAGTLNGVDNALLLTIGTGIGGSYTIGGEVAHGKERSIGEVGYMLIDGKPFQELASTTTLLLNASKIMDRDLSGYEIIKLAKEKDQQILEVIDTMAKYLAIGILNLAYVIGPEKVILGGGIMEEFDVIEPFLNKYLEIFANDAFHLDFTLSKAKLGNDAGMYGVLYKLLKSGDAV